MTEFGHFIYYVNGIILDLIKLNSFRLLFIL
jgi:hypothetical protein